MKLYSFSTDAFRPHLADVKRGFAFVGKVALQLHPSVCRHMYTFVFGEEFNSLQDIDVYEKLLGEGFDVISDELAKLDQIFVDTKFEFGYVTDRAGNEKLIYMDEVGTPDSSRIWDGPSYRDGKVVENSKEGFRQLLLSHFPDPDILLDKNRMDERRALAADNDLPESVMMAVSETYVSMAEKITGQPLVISDNPKAEIIEILKDRYGLID